MERQSLHTATEVADILKVHPKTIYAWAARGEIPLVRLGQGRMVRFRSADIERLVADRLIPAGGPK
jgi:excisionase family DNA binding protein